MRARRLVTLITVLATAGTLALTGSALGPVASSDASPGRYLWRADLDAASTSIPSLARPSVDTTTKSLLRAAARNSKATAVAAAASACTGCTGRAGTLQVIYFDGSGPVSADNMANAVSGCSDCPAASVTNAASVAVSVQVVLARKADELIVNNRAFSLNVACDGCTARAEAYQWVLVGGSRRDLSAAAKDQIGQLQDQLASRLQASDGQPAPQARISSEQGSSTITDQIEQVLVKDTGSTVVQRNADVQVG